jgi:hypothetical protein
MEITDEQLDDMLHALGKSQTPKREDMGWRNYYAAGNIEHNGWEDLCQKGMAEKYAIDNSIIYRVSGAGLNILGVNLKQ